MSNRRWFDGLCGHGIRGRPNSPESEEPVVLFVGNATEANLAALSWFISDVWPSITVAFSEGI
jgi:hypothetical protein